MYRSVGRYTDAANMKVNLLYDSVVDTFGSVRTKANVPLTAGMRTNTKVRQAPRAAGLKSAPGS
jgi:hypothetical protein